MPERNRITLSFEIMNEVRCDSKFHQQRNKVDDRHAHRIIFARHSCQCSPRQI